jgi:hypothetical protein
MRETPAQRYRVVRDRTEWRIDRRAHNPKLAGSNPAPATKKVLVRKGVAEAAPFRCSWRATIVQPDLVSGPQVSGPLEGAPSEAHAAAATDAALWGPPAVREPITGIAGAR